MSTKIYTAYRLPRRNAWDVAQVLARIARVKARKLIQKRARGMINGTPEFHAEVREKMHYSACQPLSPWAFACYLERLYVEQFKSPYNNPCDFTASLAFWTDGGGRFAYMIPHAGEGLRIGARRPFWNFLLRRPELEEYGYWNNTDMPLRISVKAWEARRRVWDRVMPHDSSRSPLCLDVVCPSTWSLLRLFRKD